MTDKGEAVRLINHLRERLALEDDKEILRGRMVLYKTKTGQQEVLLSLNKVSLEKIAEHLLANTDIGAS